MTVGAAVVASDLGSISPLSLLLGAPLGDMTKLVAVVTERKTLVCDLAGVVQARQEFLPILGPTFDLARAVRLLSEPIGDGVLLPHIALKVHVGEHLKQRSLKSDKPYGDVLIDQSLLNLTVGDISIKSLDVLIDGFHSIINIAFGSSLLKLVPSFVRGDGCNLVTVDLASVLADLAHVTFFFELA